MAIFGWGGGRRRPRTDDRATTTGRADDATRPDDAALDEALRIAAVPGFRTLDEVVAAVTATTDHEPDRVRRHATALVERLRATASAPSGPDDGPTGYERLSDAFRELATERGMIPLMGVGVDVRAARASIDRLHAEDPRPWAFVCFSMQDADALADLPAELLLTFGALRADPSIDPDLVEAAGETGHAAAAIRERSAHAAAGVILEALAAHGLDAGWDGEIGQPIVVHLTDWGKPLPDA